MEKVVVCEGFCCEEEWVFVFNWYQIFFEWWIVVVKEIQGKVGGFKVQECQLGLNIF